MEPAEYSQIIKTNSEKCINCHRCISVCPVKLCNDGSGKYVSVKTDLCIGCGKCIEACPHGARHGLDDFDRFMNDISMGEKIVAVIDPSIPSTFNGRNMEFNGWLTSLGVEKIFDASWGAELNSRTIYEHVKKNKPKLVISQSCPVIVNYIELYKPELLPYLLPASSPLGHTVTCIKKYYPAYANYKILYVSPCYAKKHEIEETGLGDYNVTLKTLSDYFESSGIDISTFPKVDYFNPAAERAVTYSTPGGLLHTVERYLPELRKNSRQISGQQNVCEYLDFLAREISAGKDPKYMFIDCLACEHGCNAGPATSTNGKSIDELEKFIDIREESRKKIYGTEKDSFFKIKKLHRVINKKWAPSIYNISYSDRSSIPFQKIRKPSEGLLWEIYKSFGKNEEKDLLNCGACGYEGCYEFACAVYNGLNKPANCTHYNSQLLQELQKTQAENLKNAIEQVKKSSLDEFSTSDRGVEDINGVAQEMVKSVNTSSSAIQEMIGNIDSINTILNKNAEVINSLTDATRAGRDSIELVSNLVEEIEKNSKGLGDMSEVIQEISSQTDLLAMNAAIEAAHAGETGDGFAVVADEIRKLAENSSMQAKQINDVLARIKKLIDKAFGATLDAKKEIENVVGLAAQVSKQEDVVKKAIAEQNSDGQEMLFTLKKMQEDTGSVTQAVEGLKSSTKKIKDAIQHISLKND